MKVTPELMQTIKVENPIHEVMEEYGVILKPDGKACCPFHMEDTPSFMVYQETGSYYCYGCGAGTKGNQLKLKDGTEIEDAGSDVIAFIQNIEQMSFQEACKTLMRRADIPIPDDKVDREMEKAKDAVMERNRRFYHSLVNSDEMMEYIENRGMDIDDVKKWRLGYVDANDKTAKYNRDRLVFSIMEEHYKPDKAKTVALAYRKLNDNEDGPKYKNDPNSKIYDKSSILYGMNYAAPHIRKKGYAIVMEGYVDVILSHKVGLENSVATCGTSFTKDQIQSLRKRTDKLYLWYDGDAAGTNGMMRVLPDLLKEGFTVFIIDSKGEDPADVAQRVGKAGIIDFILAHAKPAVQMVIDEAVSAYETLLNQEKIKALNKILPIVESIQKPSEKLTFSSEMKKRLGLFN